MSDPRIKAYIARIVLREHDKAAASDDITLLYKSAKDDGLNTSAIKKLVAIELSDQDKLAKRKEEAACVLSYANQADMAEAVQGLLF